ncbi:RagB/SusD family nutrient uptake outer membrane protein [Allomuricauda sp. CP2A]|jgi:hypothetical protein|uniref:RagB/SusD family nutrient uptake outer membrane protein n=1 Tax=Allomuricauda sp. CP2A TaxID=1848189 RepID=UPI000834FFF5|nr:RagB/SusD family nutrient uptake outer membrane protein [Muricauda sp. CP2A]
MKNIIRVLTIYSVVLTSLIGCEEPLEEELFSQLATENFLSTETGLESVLFQAYAREQRTGHDWTGMLQTDIVMTGRGDGHLGAWEGTTTSIFELWSWNETHWLLNVHWSRNYDVIYSCNTILESLEEFEFGSDFEKRLKGEALALRAHAYYWLYDFFGPVVLRTTTAPEELEKARASDEETRNQIEADFLAAIELLPVDQDAYGKITKGAAYGMLSKFYLNTKQWQKAADAAKAVIDLGKYELFPDFTTLFHIANEGNSEALWVQPGDPAPNLNNSLAGLTYPADYPFTGTQSTFPARLYVYDSFVLSYPEGDDRAKVITTEYINRFGELVVGLGNDRSYPFKYGLDPNASGGFGGNDWILLRYADILLTRAEALNELNGPNPESLDLINQVRNRAKIPELTLAEVGTKEQFRDIIFQERQWEFHYEGMTRQDMIRQGTLVSDAISRGVVNANENRALFPIPQSEMDTNRNMVQNPGY